MTITSYASSSKGNAYLVSDGVTTLLLECGIPYKQLQLKSGFIIPTVDGCLVSHSHY